LLLRLEWSLVSRTSCLSCSSTSTGGKIGGLHCSQLLLCVSGLASWPSICKWTHDHSPAFVLQVLALAFAIRIPLKNEPSSVLLFCLQDNLFTLTPALVNIFLYLHFAKLGRVISEDYRLAERNQSFAWKWWVSSNLHPLDISFISIFLLFPSSPDTLAVSLIISDTVFYLSQAIGSAFQVERQNWSQKLCLGGILLQVRWSDVATERTLSKWQQPLIIDFFTVNHFRFLHGHLYQSSSHRQEAPIWNAKLGTSRIVICQQVRVYRVSTHHQEFHYFLLVWCLDDCKCSRSLFSSRHPLSTSSLNSQLLCFLIRLEVLSESYGSARLHTGEVVLLEVVLWVLSLTSYQWIKVSRLRTSFGFLLLLTTSLSSSALVIFIVWWPSALYPISKKLLASQVWTPFFDHANKSLIPACLRRKKWSSFLLFHSTNLRLSPVNTNLCKCRLYITCAFCVSNSICFTLRNPHPHRPLPKF